MGSARKISRQDCPLQLAFANVIPWPLLTSTLAKYSMIQYSTHFMIPLSLAHSPLMVVSNLATTRISSHHPLDYTRPPMNSSDLFIPPHVLPVNSATVQEPETMARACITAFESPFFGSLGAILRLRLYFVPATKLSAFSIRFLRTLLFSAFSFPFMSIFHEGSH